MSSSTKAEWFSGAAYERYVGRWSRLVARELIAWLAVPEGRHWLDVGCGTGEITATILRQAAPSQVTGVDPSTGFLDHARATIADPRASFELGDARALPVATSDFDAVVSGLVLNFVPEPERAAREMARAARVGGVVAVYVWDYSGEMQMMRYFWDAAAALDPAVRDLDEGLRFALCRPEPLAELFRSAGLDDVETRAIDNPTNLRDLDY
jgi:ubiquinone/menaquinone biosynthesis C-methylase UbiE